MVSVIIVHYNTFLLTSDCLRSLFGHTREVQLEVIVVDNGSKDRSAIELLQEFPQVRLITSPVNLGFAGGNNLGIQAATGEYILLLNSDTLLTEDSISKSLAHLRSLPDAGVVGCRQVYPDRSVQYTARRFRSIAWELLDLFRIVLFLLPYAKRSRRMLGRYFRHDESVEADWVNGAFMLMPAAVIAQLPGGRLDERFFMYGEDVLWCEQIQKQGYRIYFFAGTSIIHLEGGSTSLEKQLSLRNVMLRHELALMSDRRGKDLYYYIFSFLLVGKEYVRYGVKWLRYRWGR